MALAQPSLVEISNSEKASFTIAVQCPKVTQNCAAFRKTVLSGKLSIVGRANSVWSFGIIVESCVAARHSDGMWLCRNIQAHHTEGVFWGGQSTITQRTTSLASSAGLRPNPFPATYCDPYLGSAIIAMVKVALGAGPREASSPLLFAAHHVYRWPALRALTSLAARSDLAVIDGCSVEAAQSRIINSSSQLQLIFVPRWGHSDVALRQSFGSMIFLDWAVSLYVVVGKLSVLMGSRWPATISLSFCYTTNLYRPGL